MTMCLGEGGMYNKRVGGRLWGDFCRQWWYNFAKLCMYTWQMGWMSGGGRKATGMQYTNGQGPLSVIVA